MHKGFRDHGSFGQSFVRLQSTVVLIVERGLSSFQYVTMPQRDDPRQDKLAKRCESLASHGRFVPRKRVPSLLTMVARPHVPLSIVLLTLFTEFGGM